MGRMGVDTDDWLNARRLASRVVPRAGRAGDSHEQHEKALDPPRGPAGGFVWGAAVEWLSDPSGRSADAGTRGPVRRQRDLYARRDRAGPTGLAVDGRHAAWLDLGAWRLRRAPRHEARAGLARRHPQDELLVPQHRPRADGLAHPSAAGNAAAVRLARARLLVRAVRGVHAAAAGRSAGLAARSRRHDFRHRRVGPGAVRGGLVDLPPPRGRADRLRARALRGRPRSVAGPGPLSTVGTRVATAA